MADNAKDFLVSAADFLFYQGDTLACTGTTNLNASLEVSMQEQNVNAGKGNKLVYSYKYGREIAVNLEAADWKLEYLAMAVGTKITEGMEDVYKLGECVVLNEGIGILSAVPVGKVAVETPNGIIITVEPNETEIDLSDFGLKNESVKATYCHSRFARSITIDAESTPMVGKLVLKAEKDNNKSGKVGEIEIVIPSYQLNGNFTINFTPDGVSSTSLEGKALAVEGDTCKDGAVYAYVREIPNDAVSVAVSDIAATPGVVELDMATTTTATLQVIGLKGAMYSPIELDNADCTFVSDSPDVATVDNTGTITAVKAGSAKVTVSYNGVSDEVDVTVAADSTP